LRKAIDYFCHPAVAPEFHRHIEENDPDFAATGYYRQMCCGYRRKTTIFTTRPIPTCCGWFSLLAQCKGQPVTYGGITDRDELTKKSDGECCSGESAIRID
jgi:hypothetical protein